MVVVRGAVVVVGAPVVEVVRPAVVELVGPGVVVVDVRLDVVVVVVVPSVPAASVSSPATSVRVEAVVLEVAEELCPSDATSPELEHDATIRRRAAINSSGHTAVAVRVRVGFPPTASMRACSAPHPHDWSHKSGCPVVFSGR